MLEAWHKDPDDYNIKLGVVWVINHILRNNAQIASKISEILTEDDIRWLVNALSDLDRTVRLQAAESLYYLKDKRIVYNSINAIRNNKNENGVYNNVLVLKEIIPSLNSDERLQVRNAVMRLVPSNYANSRALAVSIDP
jgi:HEAT repeat protein